LHCLPDDLLQRATSHQIAELQAHFLLKHREYEADLAARQREAARIQPHQHHGRR
jgi:hypothetical protein